MAHVPVLTDELLELLDVHSSDRVVDGTFGAGGHAAAVGRLLGPQGLLVACDRDPVARGYFDELKATLACPARFYLGNFADTFHQLGKTKFRATHLYLDLGVSSMQIDTQERGFSYSFDAPLDMRMDPSGPLTAEEIVNTWDERRLARLFYEYGEERYGRRIARAIVRNRTRSPVHPDRPAGRDGQGGDPHAGALRLPQPGPPRVPGAPDRRERRTRQPAPGVAGRPGSAGARRGPGGDQLPLAGGPPGQGILRGSGEAVHLPSGLSGLHLREGADDGDPDTQSDHARPPRVGG